MTDRSPDLDDLRLHADLSTWFEGEVRQAALDLRRAPLRPARARRMASRSIAAPAAGAILVTILIVAGITRLPSLAPAAEPTGTAPSSMETPEPTSTATTSSDPASPAPVPSIGRRYGDGIPELIDGMQVFRPSTVDHFPADYDRPFLLGGWSRDFAHITPSCPIQLGTPPPFGVRCGNPFLSEAPTGGRVTPVFLVGWTPDIGAGPVVVRVHRHDPMAETCEPARRALCDAIAVIEEVIWTGDDVTAAAPLTPIDVFAALNAADPNLANATLTPIGRPPRTVVSTPIPPPLPSGVTRSRLPPCESPIPMLAWYVEGLSLAYVMIFPSIEAREAVGADLEASRFGCDIVIDQLYSREWIAVDNVMVAVHVDHGGANPTQAALVEAVREALEGL